GGMNGSQRDTQHANGKEASYCSKEGHPFSSTTELLVHRPIKLGEPGTGNHLTRIPPPGKHPNRTGSALPQPGCEKANEHLVRHHRGDRVGREARYAGPTPRSPGACGRRRLPSGRFSRPPPRAIHPAGGSLYRATSPRPVKSRPP